MRRTPQQSRSVQMVDDIVEAAYVCATRRGLHRSSTHHIAEIAGVSVGNLYHYFDNKEAIFAEAHRRQIEAVMQMLRGLIPQLVQKDVAGALALIFGRFVDFLRADGGRQLAFFNQIGELRSQDHVRHVERELTALAMQYVAHNPAALQTRDFPTVIYLVINSGVLTIVNHLNHPREDISIEQLLDAIANMAAAYIASQALPAAVARRRR